MEIDMNDWEAKEKKIRKSIILCFFIMLFGAAFVIVYILDSFIWKSLYVTIISAFMTSGSLIGMFISIVRLVFKYKL